MLKCEIEIQTAEEEVEGTKKRKQKMCARTAQ